VDDDRFPWKVLSDVVFTLTSGGIFIWALLGGLPLRAEVGAATVLILSALRSTEQS
jgi:hypothetical protein